MANKKKASGGVPGAGDPGAKKARPDITDYSRFIRVEEVATICQCSTDKAYRIMRQLNKELQAQGKITIAGRVPRKYFEERMYLN